MNPVKCSLQDRIEIALELQNMLIGLFKQIIGSGDMSKHINGKGRCYIDWNSQRSCAYV